MADDSVKYSDIIKPDDSIERLIKQLGELTETYSTAVNAFRAGAQQIAHALKSVSGATKGGRRGIDEAAEAASRLNRATKELKFSMTDTGKQVAVLRDQIRNNNRISVEQARYLKQASTSYDRLNTDLKQAVAVYKSLTAEERASSNEGREWLQYIMELRSQIKAIDADLKPHIQTLSEVQKAEQRLNYLLSEEGQRYLDLKAKINEVTNSRKQQKAAIDPVTQAQEKLKRAQSDENEQLQLLAIQTREANQVAKLNAQIANSAEGSYKRLSAQYALNKIELNNMSGAQREAADVGKKLEAETLAIYQQMIKMQEATGNYKLSVGNYAKSWNGLSASVAQVVRELPSAAISMSNFFLGISNNLPIVIDEVVRLREENKKAVAEGGKATSVVKSIGRALLGWNTLLAIGSTLLAMYGDEITAWVKQLFKGEKQAFSTADAVNALNKELENGVGDYGENVVKLHQLAEEYKALRTEGEKTEWIKGNEDAFDDLSLAINDVNDADRIFVEMTDKVADSYALRAKAAVAAKLAAEKYEEAVTAEGKAEAATPGNANFWDKFKAATYTFGAYVPIGNMTVPVGGVQNTYRGFLDEIVGARKARLERAQTAAEEEAAAFEALQKKYLAELKGLGLLKDEEGSDSGSGSTSRQRDLTDTIYRMSLSVRKKYEESITDLERDEYEQRRKAAIDNAKQRIRELEETYRKNEDYLKDEKDRYKDLTDEEKAIVLKAQEEIKGSIVNIREQLNYELDRLNKGEQLQELKTLRETLQLRLNAVREGSEEEIQLRLKYMAISRSIALLENSLLPASQQLDPSLINAGYQRDRKLALGDQALFQFEEQQNLEEAKFNEVEHTEREIQRFQLEQEKATWIMRIWLARAGMLDWSDTQIEIARATVKGIDRELKKIDSVWDAIDEYGLGGALLYYLGFDDDGISAFSSVVDETVNQLQSIVDAEIEVAEAAVEAAQARVDAAQEAYDAEVEARNNGYANSVATAKKELEQEKRNQREKQKMLEEAQRRQEAIDSVTQASSLVTATANLWSSYSSLPVVGQALALAAIAAMWTSFAVAKVKAKQATAVSDAYGEGGLEFLEGGSHASGHDIDLGVENRRKRRMRAEGGEALAIINKRRTQKYRKILPDVIESLNKGTFEDKYLNAFSGASGVNISVSPGIDLSGIEGDVRDIRKQNETRYYTLPDGTVVMQRRNVRRIIKK